MKNARDGLVIVSLVAALEPLKVYATPFSQMSSKQWFPSRATLARCRRYELLGDALCNSHGTIMGGNWSWLLCVCKTTDQGPHELKNKVCLIPPKKHKKRNLRYVIKNGGADADYVV